MVQGIAPDPYTAETAKITNFISLSCDSHNHNMGQCLTTIFFLNQFDSMTMQYYT